MIAVLWLQVSMFCTQTGLLSSSSISMPPTAVLGGLVFITSYLMSHSVVEMEGTDWLEPVLVWLSSVCLQALASPPYASI